ncbi:MAG: hypothetical protein R2712_29490 [Vicinamibacterales bacterium]
MPQSGTGRRRILHRRPSEVAHGDDGDLGGGCGLDLVHQARQGVAARRIEHAGEVVDAAVRPRVGERLREPATSQSTAAMAVHAVLMPSSPERTRSNATRRMSRLRLFGVAAALAVVAVTVDQPRAQGGAFAVRVERPAAAVARWTDACS